MKRYGYGIVDREGKPWWSDDYCVCQDRGPMDDTCEILNDTDEPDPDANRRPFRVVELWIKVRKS